MSSTVSAPFKLELRRLRWQLAMTAGAILAVTVAPWVLQDVPAALQWGTSAAGLLVVVVGLYRAGWLQWQPQYRLVCDSTGEWQVADWEGTAVTSLHRDTRCFRHFIWLRLIASRSILIGPGDLDPENFRQLQVTLRRFSAAPSSERVA